ncbi:hypothetical protein SAMN04487911_10664 [Arenibacter nanhaiticus]|uniref:Uncharacterized protein n=1 Tax=Arenibacter nanhaiticus TaxID=558155 RepID=A0A1M6E8E1_9FLAO|nr:hypothetical protein SAMN04487911_10664 [Arenibacter nanhaiticus]
MRPILQHIISKQLLVGALTIGLLLILAPCFVRNFVQDEFGATPTKTINKSKSCFKENTYDDSEYVLSRKIKAASSKKALPQPRLNPSSPWVFHFPDRNIINACLGPPHFHKKEGVPLYILYKRLKYMI